MNFKPIIIIIICIALIGVVTGARAFDNSIKIIVNSSNRTKTVTRKFLADAFFKKITFWEYGESIIPVDLESDSTIRKEFSDEVMNRSVSAVRSYWQQMIFSGQTIPPVEFDTEEQVVQYVGSHPNAVGYVSAKAVLNPKVKTISWK